MFGLIPNGPVGDVITLIGVALLVYVVIVGLVRRSRR
jgi:hypothetical protein